MENIVEAQQQHLDVLLEMSVDVWPDYDRAELKATLADILQLRLWS